MFLVEGDVAPDMFPEPDDIVLRAKADLLSDKAGGVSGISGEGIESLIESISSKLSLRLGSLGVATRERHRIAMQRAVLSLDAAAEKLELGPDLYDLAAEEVRQAVRALESLVGRVDVENLLDEIFSSFCVGK